MLDSCVTRHMQAILSINKELDILANKVYVYDEIRYYALNVLLVFYRVSPFIDRHVYIGYTVSPVFI